MSYLRRYLIDTLFTFFKNKSNRKLKQQLCLLNKAISAYVTSVFSLKFFKMSQKLLSCFATELLITTLNFIINLVRSEACNKTISLTFFQISFELLVMGAIYNYIASRKENHLIPNFMNSHIDTPSKLIGICFVVVSCFSILATTFLWTPFLENLDERCTFLANFLLFNFEQFGFTRQSSSVQGLVNIGPDILQFGFPMGMFIVGVRSIWKTLEDVQYIVLVEKGSKVFIVKPVQDGEQSYAEMTQITHNPRDEERQVIEN